MTKGVSSRLEYPNLYRRLSNRTYNIPTQCLADCRELVYHLTREISHKKRKQNQISRKSPQSAGIETI